MSGFYPCDAMLAWVLAMALCLCLCPLQVGVLSEQLNKLGWFLAWSFFRPILHCIFYRAMLCMHGASHGPMSICLSVSVASQSSTKTAKHRITQTTPHDSPGTLVFWRERSPRNSTGVTLYGGAPNAGWWVKIGDFWKITGYILKIVKDRHIVSIKVDASRGPLAIAELLVRKFRYL